MFHSPIRRILGWWLDRLSLLQNNRLWLAFVNANTTSNTYFRLKNHGFPKLICGFGGKFKLQSIHGAAFDAESACFTFFRFNFDQVIRRTHSFMVTQLKVRHDPHTVAVAAISDGIQFIDKVTDAMNQTGICRLF